MSPRTAAISGFLAIVVAAIAWPTLLFQYWLMLWGGPPLEMTVRFFSFFTILSNVMVALVATSAATGGNWAPLRFWRSPRIRGLAALSITVTFLVYATILAGQWHPQGPQLVVDRSLHYILPVLYAFWWITLLPHGALVWKDAVRWLVFPLVYLVWTLSRGAVVDVYPYPFIDAGRLGYLPVLGNALMVGGLFLLVGLAFVALDRMLGARAAGSRAD
ncbi:MAG: Pr6Pr family membrane protein [Luteibacter sp.]